MKNNYESIEKNARTVSSLHRAELLDDIRTERFEAQISSKIKNIIRDMDRELKTSALDLRLTSSLEDAPSIQAKLS